ncbi:DUF802 domain-containing protein [Ottowia thiooxydans]|uniref:DUF802 domain-containing protein n=1 Tax=Ottowia thiooxydans TaxID=219182 RepID=UPI0004222051|nr:DUF802 domain-containing protein [Ottowia thiooxydans]
MTKLIFSAAFVAGLATLFWVGAGYVGGYLLALGVTLLIAAFFLAGSWELVHYLRATKALAESLHALSASPASLDSWMTSLPASLRVAVRQRVEGVRASLPAPVLAPYLTGLLVLLGMLGTFLGMVVTLHGTGAALLGAEGLQAIRDALAAPVRGLGLAFGTSVAGVGASAALGLMAAMARRDRLEVGQQLDVAIGSMLRPFTQQHQREASLRLMEQQAGLMPELVERISACMTALERQQAALSERLGAEQSRFHAETESAYTALAASVERTLTATAAETARHAGEAIQPAVQAALAGLAREGTQLQAAQAEQVRLHLDGMTARFGDATTAVTSQWTSALETHQQTSAAMGRAMSETLEGFSQTFDDRSTKLVDGLAQRMDHQAQALAAHWGEALALQSQSGAEQAAQQRQALHSVAKDMEQAHSALQSHFAEQEQSRQTAWTASLQTLASTLRDEWQQAGERSAEQWQGLGETLAQTGAGITQQLETQARNTLSEIGTLMQAASDAPRAAAEVIGELRQQLADSVKRDNAMLEERSRSFAEQEESRQAAWTASLQTLATALRDEWQQAGERSAEQWQGLGETLAQTGAGITQQLETQARNTLGEIGALMQAASEAPRAAAEVIGELRQQLAESVVRDNAILEERNRSFAAQEQSRQLAWTESLQTLATALRDEWQQAGERSAEQWQGLGETLAQTGAGITQQLEAQARNTLGEIGALMQAASEAPRAAAEVIGEMRQHLAESVLRDNAMLEERNRSLAEQEESRQVAWTASLQALATTLKNEWQQAGERSTEQWQGLGDMLTKTGAGITQQLETQARHTLGEISALMQSASEAPRAAAEVIGEMRQQLSDSMVRDNALLEERSQILKTLSTLLEAVNHAGEEQRGAIQSLVETTSGLMERANSRFADTLDTQLQRIDTASAQLTGSAAEVASLGEAFGTGVQRFGETNEQLMVQLQLIETSLSKSLARSDEQLDYYVAQAREVIELSTGAQKQIIDELRQLAVAREV